MGMWQTLGLGHLGQLVHFLSSIIHHDGGFGEHGHLPPSTHTPYEPPKYAFPTVNELYNMIIAVHLVLCHITWLTDKYETCRIFAPLHEGSMSGDVMMTSMQPRTPAPITAWQALLFKRPNIHCQGLNVKKHMIQVCPRFIDKIKKDGPHTKTCLLWVVLERAQTAGGPTVSSSSLENTFAYFSALSCCILLEVSLHVQ